MVVRRGWKREGRSFACSVFFLVYWIDAVLSIFQFSISVIARSLFLRGVLVMDCRTMQVARFRHRPMSP